MLSSFSMYLTDVVFHSRVLTICNSAFTFMLPSFKESAFIERCSIRILSNMFFLQMRSSLESTILIWNMQYHTVQCSSRTTSFRTVPHKGAEFLAKYGIYCAAFLWDSIIYIYVYIYKETVFLQNLQYSFQVLSIAWKQNQMQYSLHKKMSFNVKAHSI